MKFVRVPPFSSDPMMIPDIVALFDARDAVGLKRNDAKHRPFPLDLSLPRVCRCLVGFGSSHYFWSALDDLSSWRCDLAATAYATWWDAGAKDNAEEERGNTHDAAEAHIPRRWDEVPPLDRQDHGTGEDDIVL